MKYIPVFHPDGAVQETHVKIRSRRIFEPVSGLNPTPDPQTKKPPQGWFCCLVEMAGIEPASASTPPSALHAYSVY